ncbi:MAG: GNAT family N-acetyltransferase [Clostridiales bacterium]|nr:GNAT family N-acetyltransferase [Clostridiales bacterium]
MVSYTISKTDDYDRLVEMFIRHDLEFSIDEQLPTQIIQCWKAEDENGQLISGCVLAMRGGEYIIDGIATEPEYRKEKIGGKLLKLALEEAKKRGAEYVFLVAKAPGFFKKHGFKDISIEEVPELFDCYSCPQFQKTCHPEVMKIKL